MNPNKTVIHNNAEEAYILLALLDREIAAIPTDAPKNYETALVEIRRRVAKRARIPCGGGTRDCPKGWPPRPHMHLSDKFKQMVRGW